MLRVFCFSEGSAASRQRGDKSQPLDSSEDTFRGIRKPTAFILFPYGNIHRCCLEWHLYAENGRAGVVVHRANYFQGYSSNFIFCSGGDEMEMLHHIKDKMFMLFLKVMRLSDIQYSVKSHPHTLNTQEQRFPDFLTCEHLKWSKVYLWALCADVSCEQFNQKQFFWIIKTLKYSKNIEYFTRKEIKKFEKKSR